MYVCFHFSTLAKDVVVLFALYKEKKPVHRDRTAEVRSSSQRKRCNQLDHALSPLKKPPIKVCQSDVV